MPAEFYNRATEVVARELLGAVLECRTGSGTASGRIVETEAYLGESDLACHAAAGRTRRTAPLYGPPGIAYVYFVYGMYWCFNAVTRDVDQPSAVLVRAVEPLSGVQMMRSRRPRARRDPDLTNGPGKLCLALGIDGRHNWHPLQQAPLVVRKGTDLSDREVSVTTRIGITKDAGRRLRWFVTNNPYVSVAPSQPSGR